MNVKPSKQAQAEEFLMELLAEALLSASGQELDDILRDWGLDPSKSAANVDAAFNDALKRRNKERLEEAKRTRETEIANLYTSRSEFPNNREQLVAALTKHLAEIDSSQMTIQHRDFTDLPESALRTMLRQLIALDRQERSGNGDV
jgi:hypothetical protein